MASCENLDFSVDFIILDYLMFDNVPQLSNSWKERIVAWEYKNVDGCHGLSREADEVLKEINALGRNNWRIVPIDIGNGKIVMEREIPKPRRRPKSVREQDE